MRPKNIVSKNMSAIKSKGTKIEKILGAALWFNGFRYRKQYKKIIGKPDFVLVSKKIAIFCDSSFWHGYKNMETKRHSFKSNYDFWENKIRKNIERDELVNRTLLDQGWTVVRFWDFQIIKDVNECIEILKKIIRQM